MASPAISIIVPVYNSVGTIKKCVDSIFSQTFNDWELILADNGSTDGSGELVARIAQSDNRIKVAKILKKGVSRARNTAIELCRGAYVCFVDSDDIVEKDYLQSLYAARDADLVVCGYSVDTMTSGGKALSIDVHSPAAIEWSEGEPKANLQSLFEMGFMHFCWNKLFKHAIIKENKVRFKYIPVNEDYIFVLEYLKFAKSIRVLWKPLYHWIRIVGNVSGVKSIPDNLLAIYNESHEKTREFLDDVLIGDRIAYYSYEMIVYKYYEAIRTGRLPKLDAFKRLKELVNNPLVTAAYKSYKPKSHGDALLYSLMKRRLFKLHYFLTQKILG